MLKQMLHQACGDRRPDVRVGVGSPLPCEAPDLIRVLLDMLGDTDDRLPARIELSVGSLLAGENALCFSYGSDDTHVSSQQVFGQRVCTIRYTADVSNRSPFISL